MAFELVCGKRTVYTVWGRPSLRDIVDVEAAMVAASERAGGRIVYVARVPVNGPAPDPEVRNFLQSRLPYILPVCESYNVVLEGEGLVVVMKRMVATALFQFTGERGFFHVFPSIDAFLRSVHGDTLDDVQAVLATARRRNLLNGPLPTTLPPSVTAP